MSQTLHQQLAQRHVTGTVDTTPQENTLAQWMGDCSYLQAHGLYLEFGDPSWFRDLAARFVHAVHTGCANPQMEDPAHEFLAWAAMDLGLRKPQLHRNLAFHARLEQLMPRWTYRYLT